MDICDTAHGNKGKIVQEPAHDGVETRVENVLHVSGLEVFVAALPADEVKGHEEGKDAEGGGGTPVDDGVAEEEVLDDCMRLGSAFDSEKA